MVSLLIGHVHANILQAKKVESRMLMTCTWRVSHPLRLVEKIAISKRKRKATKPGCLVLIIHSQVQQSRHGS